MRGFFMPPEMIWNAVTNGTPDFSMVANWRLNTATSLELTRPAGAAKQRFGFFLDGDRVDALTAKFRPHQSGVYSYLLPLEFNAPLIASLPQKYCGFCLSRSHNLVLGYPVNFNQVSLAGGNLVQCRLPQINDPFFSGLLGNCHGVSFRQDDFGDVI